MKTRLYTVPYNFRHFHVDTRQFRPIARRAWSYCAVQYRLGCRLSLTLFSGRILLSISRVLERFLIEHIEMKNSWDFKLHFECICSIRIPASFEARFQIVWPCSWFCCAACRLGLPLMRLSEESSSVVAVCVGPRDDPLDNLTSFPFGPVLTRRRLLLAAPLSDPVSILINHRR